MKFNGCYNCNYEEKVPGVCKCDENLNSNKTEEKENTTVGLKSTVRRLFHGQDEVYSAKKQL